MGGQLVRAGTSVGANYRAACRARSRAEFTARLGIVEEEADESGYWLEMIIEGRLMKASRVTSLLTEADELVAIMTSSRITMHRKEFADKQNQRKRSIKNHQSKIKNHITLLRRLPDQTAGYPDLPPPDRQRLHPQRFRSIQHFAVR